MFKFIGGLVVLGFASYGYYRWMMDRKEIDEVKEREINDLKEELKKKQGSE